MSYNQDIASNTKYGVVKVGSGIDVTNGLISSTLIQGATGLQGATGANGSAIVTNSYYGKFFSSTTQTNTGINTIIPISFPNTDSSNEITTSGTQITFNKAGVYTLTYEVQAEITSGGGGNIDIWISNAINLTNSNSITTIPGGGNKTIINRSFLVTVTAGDKISVNWSSPMSNMQLTPTGAQTGPIRPATSSANFLATLVKAL